MSGRQRRIFRANARPTIADPRTCVQCAALKSRATGVAHSGDPEAARRLLIAMRLHLVYGHPKDPAGKLFRRE